MALEWKFSLDGVDWEELSALYRAAPLGDKKAADLELVFSNSMFRCFVYDDGRLIGAGRALADGKDASYLCDIAVHPSHQGLGVGRHWSNGRKGTGRSSCTPLRAKIRSI